MATNRQLNPAGLYRQFGAGDRANFAVSLEFLPNPETGMATPEEDASWGRFSLWVRGRNLCAHYVDGVLQEAVTWQTLSVLEWLAAEWDFILHEQRFPLRNAAGNACRALEIVNTPATFERSVGWDTASAEIVGGWTTRHSLQFQRDGGLFPDIWIRRRADDAEVSWGTGIPMGAPRGFQFVNGDGSAILPPGLIAEPLYLVLDEATRHLSAMVPGSERLIALRVRIERLTDAARRDERVGILAGLGGEPAAWKERWARFMGELGRRFAKDRGLVERLFGPPPGMALYVSGACRGALMFGSASPQLDEEDVYSLATLLLQHATRNRGADKLATAQDAAGRIVEGGGTPWTQGYALAAEWADKTKLPCKGETWVDVEGHLKAQGVDVQNIRLRDASIGAVAVAAEGCRPLVAINECNPRNGFPTGRRFTLAHELCHLLHDRQHGVELATISGAWAPYEIEQRANAFAARLLMPDGLLDRNAAADGVRFDKLDFAGVVRLAKRLQVSVDALLHHLTNRGWIAEECRDQLVAQLENRPLEKRKGRQPSVNRTRPARTRHA